MIIEQIGNGAKFSLDIYHCGDGLAVTGRIRDIGQKSYDLLFEQEAAAAPVTSKFSTLLHSSRKPLLVV